jgi:hypothetical protein
VTAAELKEISVIPFPAYRGTSAIVTATADAAWAEGAAGAAATETVVSPHPRDCRVTATAAPAETARPIGFA